MRLRHLLTILLLILSLPALAGTLARPTLWHVRGPQGEAWLLGSIHALPPDIEWRSPEIARALKKTDIFVFEVPLDEKAAARLQELVAAHGYLPQGQSLRAMLHPQARQDFDAALAASGLPQAAIDRDRPWLAGLQMLFAQASQQQYAARNGVDTVLMAEARKAGKPLRYLETVEQQFALLAPEDPALELEEFESGLKDMRDLQAEIGPMVEAWSKGDQKALDTLINGDLDGFPAARKLLLDDRNRSWIPQIARMLREKHRFFITVGAGHLTGPKGVPALLRQAGYKVEGP